MKKFIVILIVLFSINVYIPCNTYAYNIHQAKEAEKKYDKLTKVIDNIEKALKDLAFAEEVDRRKKESKDNFSFIIADLSITLSNEYVNISPADIIVITKEVDICREVVDLIRDEFKILLQKNLKELKKQRDLINVE